MTLVSIIMPVWKPRPDWLRNAVASVLAENNGDVELIMVDDGNEIPIAETLSDIEDARLLIIRVAHVGTGNVGGLALAELITNPVIATVRETSRWRPAVRGLRLSISQSASRLNVMAAVRAKAIARTIRRKRRVAGHPLAATTMAPKAKGSAKTVWEKRMKVRNRTNGFSAKLMRLVGQQFP